MHDNDDPAAAPATKWSSVMGHGAGSVAADLHHSYRSQSDPLRFIAGTFLARTVIAALRRR
jgi:hypothetical protein